MNTDEYLVNWLCGTQEEPVIQEVQLALPEDKEPDLVELMENPTPVYFED